MLHTDEPVILTQKFEDGDEEVADRIFIRISKALIDGHFSVRKVFGQHIQITEINGYSLELIAPI